MSADRRRSLLEDDDIAVLGRNEASGGDVCDDCNCTRERHNDDGCACGRCEGFTDRITDSSEPKKTKKRRPSRAGRR